MTTPQCQCDPAAEQAGGAGAAGADQGPGGEWGISMTIADFLSDRLGRIVLQGGARRPPPVFLLTTGTQPAWWLCS